MTIPPLEKYEEIRVTWQDFRPGEFKSIGYHVKTTETNLTLCQSRREDELYGIHYIQTDRITELERL